jgi:AraC-like DNA-binding protein
MDMAQWTDRLKLFGFQISQAIGVSLWSFDKDKRIFFANSEHVDDLWMIFEISGCLDYAIEKSAEYSHPLFLSDELDLIWVADFMHLGNDGCEDFIIMIGPIFNNNISIKITENKLNNISLPHETRNRLLQILRNIPVLTMANLHQYAIMMHCAIVNSPTNIGDFHYQKPMEIAQDDERNDKNESVLSSTEHQRITEYILLNLIREGNLGYKSVFNEATAYVNVNPIDSGSSIRDAKISVTIFVALSARAAVEGGLSPNAAKTLELHYIKNIELCNTITGLVNISHTMFDDFVRRVHKCKTGDYVSPTVQNCCAYIQANAKESLKLNELAERAGYKPYYFSKKFKKEVGVSIAEYVKKARIDYARSLLMTTNISIQEISDLLNFNTRNYFCSVFASHTGMSPIEYRESKHR